MKWEIMSIKTHDTQGKGSLSVLEEKQDLPFNIKRIYYIYDTPQGVIRGSHAHKVLKQLMFCPHGSIRIILDDGRIKESVILNRPDIGLLTDKLVWCEMQWEKADSVLCVCASEHYDEDDYIFDYDEFVCLTRAEK